MKIAPKKFRIYETIASLNRGFEMVLINLDRLRRLGFRPDFMTAFTIKAEYLRAETNQELMESLKNIELDDRTKFGRKRERWERQLRGRDRPHSKPKPKNKRNN